MLFLSRLNLWKSIQFCVVSAWSGQTVRERKVPEHLSRLGKGIPAGETPRSPVFPYARAPVPRGLGVTSEASFLARMGQP